MVYADSKEENNAMNRDKLSAQIALVLGCMLSHHRKIVNAMADAVSAAANGHMRVSRAIGPTATAALVPDVWGAEDEIEASLDLEGVVERVNEPVGVVAADPVDKGAPEAELDPVDLGPADALELPVELKVGGGVAVDGSTSAPVPNATVCPFDCSVSVAGVEEPSAPAIVKRVVQVKLPVPAAVNW